MATDATGTPTPLGVPKYNTAVDAPSGLGFNAAMDAIDALLQLRAPLVSPTFTGVPSGPTAAVDTSTTQLASTAYVVGQGYAKLSGAAFTGAVTDTVNITARLGLATQVSIGDDGATRAAIIFGTGVTTAALYLGSAGIVGTDGGLSAGRNDAQALQLTGASAGITFGGSTTVQHDSSSGALIQSQTGGNSPEYQLYTVGGTVTRKWGLGAHQADGRYFIWDKTSNVERLRINTVGDVLINPGASTQIDLDVDGNIYFGSATAGLVLDNDTFVKRLTANALSLTSPTVLIDSGGHGYVEIPPATTAAAPATTHSVRLQNIVSGAKGQLVAYWPGGSTTVIATEP